MDNIRVIRLFFDSVHCARVGRPCDVGRIFRLTIFVLDSTDVAVTATTTLLAIIPFRKLIRGRERASSLQLTVKKIPLGSR